MTSLLVLGAGAVAREVVDIVERVRNGDRKRELRIHAFVEDDPKPPRELRGLPVRSTKDALGLDPEAHRIVCATGAQERGAWIERFEQAGFHPISLIDPHATVSPTASVREGAIVYPGAIVSAGAKVGRHAIVQPNASVMHDVELDAHVTVAPGVQIGGHARIGDRVFLGIGAAVADRVTIGDGTIVGAGATVTDDLGSNITAVGTPARPIQEPDA